MYLKKKYKELLQEFDDKVQLPTKFNSYVNKIKQSHRLIIKSKDGYQCDNCHHRFINHKSIRQFGEIYIHCPNCKKWLIVKTNRKKYFKQADTFCIMEKFNDHLIFRLFAVRTEYVRPKSYVSHICEYGRQIFEYQNYLNSIVEVYNDNVSATISGKWINHKYFLNDNWKADESYYHGLGNTFMLYPYNVKKTLKDTKWEYSQLWDLAKHVYYLNIQNFMQHSSLELIIKNKLYKLAYSILNEYDLIKLDYKFINRHLKFIRRNNLSLDELIVFEKINKENIKLIRNYSTYANNFTQIFFELKIDLEKADKEIIGLKKYFCEYIDYLEMCRLLQYDMKNKKILYPHKNIIDEHDRVNNLYITYKNSIYNNNIKERFNEIKKNTYKNKKYIIFPVKNQRQLIDESKQQNNCVKTYADRIAKGQCDIYFMRLLTNQKKSLVTVEVRDNKVVQQRTKNNENTTKEQRRFLSEWEEKMLRGVS